MKVSISSIGSRGEVQPIIALALELRALGHEAAPALLRNRQIALTTPSGCTAWLALLPL
jgi:hypothetical protein